MKKAKNREEAITLENKFEGQPHGMVQWKGTNVCMDVYCKCGQHTHFDGYFANNLKCPHCGTVYYCSPNIEFIEMEEQPQHFVTSQKDAWSI
jgi:hypothetical protein